MMDNTEYLQRVSQRCFELSTQCFHLEIAGKLRNLGNEINSQASAQDIHRSDFSAKIDPASDRDASSRRRTANGLNKALLTRTRGEVVRRHPIMARIADLAARTIAAIHHHKRGVNSLHKT